MKKPFSAFIKVAPVQIGGAWAGAGIANTAKYALGHKLNAALVTTVGQYVGAKHASTVAEGILEGLIITAGILSFQAGYKMLAPVIAIGALFTASPQMDTPFAGMSSSPQPQTHITTTHRPIECNRMRHLSCRIG